MHFPRACLKRPLNPPTPSMAHSLGSIGIPANACPGWFPPGTKSLYGGMPEQSAPALTAPLSLGLCWENPGQNTGMLPVPVPCCRHLPMHPRCSLQPLCPHKSHPHLRKGFHSVRLGGPLQKWQWNRKNYAVPPAP